jgi:hypothetical protein
MERPNARGWPFHRYTIENPYSEGALHKEETIS